MSYDCAGFLTNEKGRGGPENVWLIKHDYSLVEVEEMSDLSPDL